MKIHFQLIDNIELDLELKENFDMVGSFDVHNMPFIPRIGEEVTFNENRIIKKWGNCQNKKYFAATNTYRVDSVFYDLDEYSNRIVIAIKLLHNLNRTCSLSEIS